MLKPGSHSTDGYYIRPCPEVNEGRLKTKGTSTERHIFCDGSFGSEVTVTLCTTRSGPGPSAWCRTMTDTDDRTKRPFTHSPSPLFCSVASGGKTPLSVVGSPSLITMSGVRDHGSTSLLCNKIVTNTSSFDLPRPFIPLKN